MTRQPAEDAEALRLPPHGRRLWAFVIDSAVPVVAIAAAGTVALRALLEVSGGWTLGLLVLIALVVGTTNGLVTWLSGGSTVGKAWAGLQVMHMNEQPIQPDMSELPKVIARYTLGYFGIDVLLIGSLYALRDPRHRPLHDFVLGYEVVALSQASPSTRERLRAFGEDLDAGRELIKEQWGGLGVIVSIYIAMVVAISNGLVWAVQNLGLSAPSGHSVSTSSISAMPATVPTTAVAGGVAVGGTALAAATIVASGMAITPGTAAYPGELTLVPAVQYVKEAYPLGLPPDIHLVFHTGSPATAAEIRDLVVVTAAVHSTVTLTFTDSELKGRSFKFDDVLVPTKWRTKDLESIEVRDWNNLKFTTNPEGFIPKGMAVADIRRQGSTTEGFKVASSGSLVLAFPYRGDGHGHIDQLGVVVTWTGNVKCAVVDKSRPDRVDPYKKCNGKQANMFWVWGANKVTWGTASRLRPFRPSIAWLGP